MIKTILLIVLGFHPGSGCPKDDCSVYSQDVSAGTAYYRELQRRHWMEKHIARPH